MGMWLEKVINIELLDLIFWLVLAFILGQVSVMVYLTVKIKRFKKFVGVDDDGDK